jgi:hypothetical protein
MVNTAILLYQNGSLSGHRLGIDNEASTQRYAHVDRSTLMSAAEAGASKPKVNWKELNLGRVPVLRDEFSGPVAFS